MTAETSIQVALALPVIATVLAALFGQRPNLREMCTLLSAGSLVLVVASLAPEVFAGGRPAVTLFAVMPGLAIAFQVEPLGMLFALVASSLWLVTTCIWLAACPWRARARSWRRWPRLWVPG